MTEKFSNYLGHGSSFTVYTDNNPLTYVMSSAKLNATGMRWVNELSEYDFTLKYRPGRLAADADGLSRNPLPVEETSSSSVATSSPVAAAFPPPPAPLLPPKNRREYLQQSQNFSVSALLL